MYSISYPKYKKGGYIVREIKENSTFSKLKEYVIMYVCTRVMCVIFRLCLQRVG